MKEREVGKTLVRGGNTLIKALRQLSARLITMPTDQPLFALFCFIESLTAVC